MLQILVETTALDLKQINNIAQDKHSITYSLYPCNIFGKDVTERERESYKACYKGSKLQKISNIKAIRKRYKNLQMLREVHLFSYNPFCVVS